jgi:L-fuculose-phosphate aldolase
MSTETVIRENIVHVVRKLEELGLNSGSVGNVSCRFGDHVLITPTGAHSGTLTADRVVKIGYDGEVKGDGIPSSEWELHTEVLRAYPTAQSVDHTHADHCVALACLREPIPAFHYMIAGFGGNDVRCADYAAFGSTALSAAVVAALKDRSACLLANHGMVVHGKSLDHALTTAVELETLARQYLLARQGGTPVLLTEGDMQEVHRRYGYYGQAAMPR